ncbi:helix-turn-helix transcriptional regulator [uncultured Tolumonas sp.]|uniref:helix-turn-helix transcriptional regulator n=1 Tax=uncultured Tolumonas sp. TaxID=263765 RepID=UPI002A0A1392|nr:helix-turn-helix transcriptional regulator [uncultured Tolumonas sp.]
MPKSVSNVIMRNVLHKLKGDGVNTRSIIEYCGVSDYEIERDNGRIAEHKHYRFMLKTKEYLQPVNDFIFDNFMALSFQNHPDFFGICLNESSAKEALDSYIRYRIMIGNCDDLIKHAGVEKSSFEYINLGPKELGASQAIFNFIMLYSIVKNYSNSFNINVRFVGKPPQKKHLLDVFFNTQCLWEQNNNSIVFNNQELDRPRQDYNGSLNSMQKTRLNELCRKLESDSDYSSLIKEMIIHSIHLGRFDGDDSILEDICNNLSISRWTLNRKLQNENTSFITLLKETKIKMACELLIESKYTMQEISESIGFSSQSVFSRFFKTNLSVSPLAFRDEHRTK